VYHFRSPGKQSDIVAETTYEARKAAASPWTRRLARWGLVSKGALYGLVGAIAIDVAIGGGGRIQNRSGALAAAADHWLGKLLVAAIAVGLAGYAVWRFGEALLGRTLEATEQAGWPRRIGFVAAGLWYLGLCGVAVAVLVGSNQAAGSRQEDQVTARALELPLGRWLVAAVGLGIIGAGAFNVFNGLTRRFRKDLKLRRMSDAEEHAFTAVGVVGHVARGVVFGLIGFFLVRAAYQYDPKEAVGLDGALGRLLRHDYGPALLGLVAAGLLAYGCYCFVEARYREV
jgi:Domain of Unknown Function (DUF1206)